ncbi:MAG: glycoside hydrolase family 44 protein [Limisphaerales bacterium]
MRISCARSLLALALGVASGTAAQTPQVIYDGQLENGWENWSWATVSLSATSPVVHGEAHSISVEAGGYQALYLEQGAVDVSAYLALSFWINGGASGGQTVGVAALTNGSSVSVYPLSPLLAGQWANYIIPLTVLGVANSVNFDGLWFWNTTGGTEPAFYVGDIVLTPAGPPAPNPTNLVMIDVASNRHPISSMIYGMAFASASQLSDLNCTMNRSGGNEESTYNWEVNAHGKGANWFFESYPDSSSVAGESADSVVQSSKTAGAQTLITIPMMDWGPKLGANRTILPSYSIAKYGPQTDHDPYLPDAGNGISVTNGTPITWNHPNDSYVPVDTNFQKAYVEHLTNNWGVSTNGGVGCYIMDNEHSLWYQTHRDIHPVGTTMREILGKMIAYASMVKSVDPNALVLGPEEWGWNGYLYSGYDQQWSGQHNDFNANDYPDRKANGGWDYMPWLLDQLHQHDTNSGVRLLDCFTLHCYPQEGNVGNTNADPATELLRNASTRQLWDSNYVDPSWINSVIDLIPRMKAWVSTNYPGTKGGITEYNWGGEDSISGGTAQADVLGIFGREGLDLATRWTVPDPNGEAYLACKMYRNYDGKKSTFGDMSISAGGTNNPDTVAVFAAQRSSDAALTIMVVSKYLTGVAPLVLNVAHFTNNGPAQVWQLKANNVIAQLPNITPTNGVLRTTVPGQSVTLFVLPASHVITFTPGAARTDGQFEFWVNGQMGEGFTRMARS